MKTQADIRLRGGVPIRLPAEAKRARELAQYERFANACGCISPGPCIQPDPPEPDIVVGPADARIGIEFTDLHPGDDGEFQRHREGDQAAIVMKARREYIARGYPPADVLISWARHGRIASRELVAERLAMLVAAQLPLGPEFREVRNLEAGSAQALPIEGLAVTSASSHLESAWRDGDMHKLGFCTAADIQARLVQEDSKVGRYRDAYASRWLVLVVGAGGPSTWGYVTDELRKARFRSSFDRVFVFKFSQERTIELQLARPE